MKIVSLWIIVLLYLFTGLLHAQANNSENYLKLYNEGQYSETIKFFSTQDTMNRSARDWFYLAQSCNAIKDIKQAVVAYSKAVKINPDHNGYRLFFARALNIYGDVSGAEENYQKIILNDSENIVALSDLGTMYLNSKKYQKAIPYFEALVKINENDFLSRYNIALAAFNFNPVNPDSNVIPNQLAWCLISNPRYNPARELLGLYHYTKGNYRAALSEYQILTWNRNVHPDIYFRTGQCLEKLKSYTAAIGSYKEAIKLDSTNANYFSHLGYCYYLNSNLDSAVSAYKYAAQIDKENPTTYINLGMIYSGKDSLGQAVNCFRISETLSSVKQVEFIYNQLGYLYLKMKEFKMAKLYCEKTILLNENNSIAIYNLARINDELKQYKAAVKFYEASIENFKEDAGKQKEYEYAVARARQLKEK